MKIAVLSNVELRASLDELRRMNSEVEIYTPGGYGVWMQELLDENSQLVLSAPELVFLILDGTSLFESFREDEIESIFETIKSFVEKHASLHFFISEIDVWNRQILPNDELDKGELFEWKWNRAVYTLASSFERIHAFKLKELIESEGRKAFYNDKLWYLGGIRYSSLGHKKIADEMEVLIRAYRKQRKKVLVLDLDNTLWGGILGEAGLDGIELADVKEGRRFKDFQMRIKELKDTGVLLTICSKNNESDVMEAFEKHRHMVLKKDDFVRMKINWENKLTNIKELAEELNLGIDSFVFIDDNPAERELIKTSLPCEVPDFPIDTARLNDFAWEIYKRYFYTLKVNIEDVKKTEMYLKEMEREKFKESVANLEEYLKSLNMKMKIRKLKEEDVQRAAELTQKTNQFNLTTLRLTEAEIRARMSNPNYSVYIASVEDRFGEYGKVLLAFVKKDYSSKVAEFENLLMSCRVFGRYLEDQFVGFIENELLKEGIQQVKARYIPTAKNKPAQDFFDRLGYEVETFENGEKAYKLDIRKAGERHGYAFVEYEG
ncbi:HAD-IIIC family phosphatase [Fervidobacterium sp.]